MSGAWAGIFDRRWRLARRAQGRFLWRHRLLTGLLILGVALGVAIIHATDLANAGTRHTLQQVRWLLEGDADARITRPGGVDAAQYAQLRREWLSRHPGLELRPVVVGRIWVDRERWHIRGVDPVGSNLLGRLGATGEGAAGTRLIGRHAAVLSAADADRLQLSAGDPLPHGGPEGSPPLIIEALAEGEHARLLQRHLITDIATAQHLLGRSENELDHIDVFLPAGAANLGQRLADELPQSLHWTPGSALATEDALIEAVQFNLSALSLLALAVGAFLVISMADDLFCQRRPLLHSLWLSGVPAATLRRLLLGEALALALAGLLLGWWLGGNLGRALLPVATATLGDVPPLLPTGGVGPASLARTALLALGLTLITTHLMARRWPTAPRVTRTGPVRALAIATCLLIALLLLAMPSGLTGAFAAMAAIALAALLCAPEGLRLVARLLGAATTRWPLARIGCRDAGRAPLRLCLGVAALTLALAASLSVALMVGSLRGSLDGWLERQLQAELFVQLQPWQDGNALAEALTHRAGVAATSHSVHVQLDTDLGPVRVEGLSPGPAGLRDQSLLDCAGDCLQRWHQRGEALASEPLARRLALQPGDPLTLPATDGEPVEIVISGIMRDYNIDGGRLLLSRDRFDRHWPGLQPGSIGVYLDAGADAGEVAAQLRDEDLQVVQTGDLRAAIDRLFDQTFAIARWLRLLVLLIALAAVAGGMLIHFQLQRRQLATLRALGASRRAALVWTAMQALTIALTAGLLALPLGYALGWLLVEVVNPRAFGWSLPLYWQPVAALTTLAMALAAGTLALLVPWWQERRVQPGEGLRRE